MRKKPIHILALVAVIVAIAVVAGVIYYVKSRPTVTLRTLFSVKGYCYRFSDDGADVAIDEYPTNYSGLGGPIVGQSIYDANLGTERLSLPVVDDAISFSSDSAFVGVPGKGVYTLRGAQLVLALGSDSYLFSPDNRFVAASANGVYELASSKQIVAVHPPVSMAFSHDSRYVALIGDAGGDSVYDLVAGKQMFSAPRDKGFGMNAYFSPNGQYLTVESDGIYQVATGKKIVQTGALSFSADSATAATAYGIYDLASGQRLFPESLASDTTAYSKLSSDGKIAVILTYEPPARPTDAIITTVFDIPSRKTLFQIRTPPEGRVYFDAILSPDGQSLAVWHDGVYAIPSGNKRFSIDPKGGLSTYTTAPLSFSKDSSLLYVSDGAAYDMQTGGVRFAMNADTLGGNQNIMGDMVSVSSDGRLISDYVGVYDAATGIRLAKGDVTFPPDSNKVAVSSKPDGMCTVFEMIPA